MPIIQTVFETLRDIKEEKVSKSVSLESASSSSSGNKPALCCRIVCEVAPLVTLSEAVLLLLAFVCVSVCLSACLSAQNNEKLY